MISNRKLKEKFILIQLNIQLMIRDYYILFEK